MALIKIFENDNFIVDYNKNNNRYRVSVFNDNHFWDEVWFDAYSEENCKCLQEVLNNMKPNCHKDIVKDMQISKDVINNIIEEVIANETTKW